MALAKGWLKPYNSPAYLGRGLSLVGLETDSDPKSKERRSSREHGRQDPDLSRLRIELRLHRRRAAVLRRQGFSARALALPRLPLDQSQRSRLDRRQREA